MRSDYDVIVIGAGSLLRPGEAVHEARGGRHAEARSLAVS
jgi:hypothetical protein